MDKFTEPTKKELIKKPEEELAEAFLSHFDKMNLDTNKLKELFESIISLHKEPGRLYHGVKHLKHIYDFLIARNASDIQVLIMATLFHDSIYDTKSKTNEIESAELARQRLTEIGIPEDFITSVLKIILATEKHSPENLDSDGLLFLDADLLILSSPSHVYDTYADNIRKEYSWVSDDDFRIGRIGVLNRFLQREKIYFSDGMHDEEMRARKNIKREIEILSRQA